MLTEEDPDAVVVEKPVALDLGTAEPVAEKVEEASIVTQVGYNYRYCAITDEARSLIGDRDIALVDRHWVWDSWA